GGVITGTTTLCVGATSQLAGPGAPSAVNPWVSSNTAVATVSNTGVVTGVSAGTATITYTNSSGCPTTTTVTISPLPPTPTISIIQATCTTPASASISNYVAGQTYTFSPLGPTVSATGVISNTTTGTSYTVTTNNGTCTSNASTSFSLTGALVTPTISGTLTTCINATTQLTGSGTPAASNPWTSNNTGVAAVSSTGLVTGVASGTATITYTNSAGCSVTATITVSDIIDWANLQFPGNGSICQGGTYDIYGQLYNTGSVNTPDPGQASGVTVQFGYSTTNTDPSTWTNWSNANFNVQVGNNDEYMGTLTGLAPGTYYYAFRYQINGCGWQYGGYSAGGGGIWNGTSNVSGQLTVTSPTIPTFTSVGPFCSGATISALPTTSTNGITGTWSPAINNTATTTYTFTPTAGQCATTASLTITITPIINSTFIQVGEICSGGTFSLPSSSNEGIIGTWSPAINTNSTTTYTFTPSVGQCGTSANMIVTVTPTVSPQFTQISPICSGELLSPLPTTSNNGITGTWSPTTNNLATTTYNFTPSHIPGPDCDQAVLICNPNQVISVSNLNGAGNNDEEPESGSCMDVPGPNEQNSAWFIFNASNSGNLTFDIIPNLPNDDIDFILYQINTDNPCGPRTIIRCNSASCLNSTGSTGLSMTDSDISEDPNCDPGENAYCQFVQTTPGAKYALLINNCNTNQGFTLQFNNGIPNPVSFAQPNASSNFYNATNCIGQCATTTSMTITVNPEFNLVVDTAFCSNILPVIWNGQSINGPGNYTANLLSSNGCDSIVTLNVLINTLSASTTQTNVLCYGNTTGSINLTVVGGTSPYTYLWNTTPTQTTEDLSNLAAGTYTTTITDNNGCTTTASATISQPATGMVASTTQVNVLCNGNSTGSIDLTLTGGTGTYTYSWNTTPA
ncbi:MAG: Ig-like domain-containing protein, partial [Bacteroidota bacterium]